MQNICHQKAPLKFPQKEIFYIVPQKDRCVILHHPRSLATVFLVSYLFFQPLFRYKVWLHLTIPRQVT